MIRAWHLGYLMVIDLFQRNAEWIILIKSWASHGWYTTTFGMCLRYDRSKIPCWVISSFADTQTRSEKKITGKICVIENVKSSHKSGQKCRINSTYRSYSTKSHNIPHRYSYIHVLVWYRTASWIRHNQVQLAIAAVTGQRVYLHLQSLGAHHQEFLYTLSENHFPL